MKDAIGNRIQKGDLVHWAIDAMVKERGVIANVFDVIEPRVEAADGTMPSSPMLILQLAIPVMLDPRNPRGEVTLSQFTCVRDPRSQAIAERLIEGVTERPQ
jgi:hypothetical protein